MAVSTARRPAANGRVLIITFLATLICRTGSTDVAPGATTPEELPHRRFEYKYSFKGPHLSQTDGGIPFWIHTGKWAFGSLHHSAVWFTSEQGLDGPVYGAADQWNGVGIFFDSFDNDGKKNNPSIVVVGNNGKLVYDHQNDGTTQALGTCLRDFRNKPYPIRAKITYYQKTLTVMINNGFTPDRDDYEFCTKVDNMVLPGDGFFGISAATGGLAEEKDKYQEEFQNFQQELDKKKEEFQKEHPDVQGEQIEDMYESVNDREIRQVFEGQNQIHLEIKQLHRQLAMILDEQRRYVSVISNEVIKWEASAKSGQLDAAAQQQLVSIMTNQLEVLKSLNELRSSFHESLKQIGSAQHQGNAAGIGAYETAQHFNDIKEHLHMVKRDVEHLVQRNSQNPAEKAVKCPEPPAMPACLSTVHFVIFIIVQSVLFFCYIMYKSQQEAAAKKFF
ncbi:Protein ERGIC-53 [Liparis tanakae]|uniref:Protein ERGIC-53 n=1 Tax=Liparis tanakae TaxID=230148 RepID=A0A4Z2J772_9TELE|nr:Protein ERGIC-53 [Liparis tanakae]